MTQADTSVQAVMVKRFVQTPADVSSLREGVPRGVARAIQKSLARTPIDRFETAGAMLAALRERSSPVVAAPAKSIAVLPFASMSADPEHGYFADGITEEILNAIGQLSDLRVAGRSSSFSYKGQTPDLRTVGDQLNVRTVLEGSVRRAGKRVRITARLTDVADGFQLWSERYDRDVEDVFAVQDEIAQAIADRLKASISDAPKASRDERAPESIKAYEAYLKGRALLNKRGNSVPEGMTLMRRALELDANYALAWSGLADAYSLTGIFGMIAPEDAGPQAREAAERAIACAPNLAESHASLALVRFLFDWDFPAAEREFARARELNPRYSQAAAWYYLVFAGYGCGRFQEAVDGLIETWESDPRSAYLCCMISIAYSTGLTDPRSVEWAAKALAIEPDGYLALWARLLGLSTLRQWPDVIVAAQAALANSGRQIYPLGELATAYVAAGERDKAVAVYEELTSRSMREYIAPSILAIVAAQIGERDQAVKWTLEARRRKDPGILNCGLGWVMAEPWRAMPEHQAVLREIGIPVLSSAAPRN